MEAGIQRNDVFNVLRKDDCQSRNTFIKISLKRKSELDFSFRQQECSLSPAILKEKGKPS